MSLSRLWPGAVCAPLLRESTGPCVAPLSLRSTRTAHLPVPEHREVAQEVRLGSCRRDHLPGVAARGCRLDCRAFTRSIGERELGELPPGADQRTQYVCACMRAPV